MAHTFLMWASALASSGNSWAVTSFTWKLLLARIAGPVPFFVLDAVRPREELLARLDYVVNSWLFGRRALA